MIVNYFGVVYMVTGLGEEVCLNWKSYKSCENTVKRSKSTQLESLLGHLCPSGLVFDTCPLERHLLGSGLTFWTLSVSFLSIKRNHIWRQGDLARCIQKLYVFIQSHWVQWLDTHLLIIAKWQSHMMMHVPAVVWPIEFSSPWYEATCSFTNVSLKSLL